MTYFYSIYVQRKKGGEICVSFIYLFPLENAGQVLSGIPYISESHPPSNLSVLEAVLAVSSPGIPIPVLEQTWSISLAWKNLCSVIENSLTAMDDQLAVVLWASIFSCLLLYLRQVLVGSLPLLVESHEVCLSICLSVCI